MLAKYQLVFIGHKNDKKIDIKNTFKKRVEELGLPKDSINFIEEDNFPHDYKANAPTVGIYFGDHSKSFPDLNILNRLVKDSTFILPVVSSLDNFTNQVPEKLHSINGIQVNSIEDVEKLVGSILEGFGLLRLERRLFISYRRKESRSVAIQLYEKLEEANFDVFLDTHSVGYGDPFQEELWHRLVDTDIVVLLNTPGFLESEWTKEELAKASAMSIGILQMIWPNHDPENHSALCYPESLNEDDFTGYHNNGTDSFLTDTKVKYLVGKIESLRARSLAARQDNIIREFMAAAEKKDIHTTLHPEKIINFKTNEDKDIALIPTIGVPRAFTYNQKEEIIHKLEGFDSPTIYLLYDHRNIRDKWQNHLSWLNQHLPVRTIKITEADEWLQTVDV